MRKSARYSQASQSGYNMLESFEVCMYSVVRSGCDWCGISAFTAAVSRLLSPSRQGSCCFSVQRSMFNVQRATLMFSVQCSKFDVQCLLVVKLRRCPRERAELFPRVSTNALPNAHACEGVEVKEIRWTTKARMQAVSRLLLVVFVDHAPPCWPRMQNTIPPVNPRHSEKRWQQTILRTEQLL